MAYQLSENMAFTSETRNPLVDRINADFAVWAEQNLRVRKPTTLEQPDPALQSQRIEVQTYYDSVPLLKDANPKLYATILEHFNKMTEIHYSYTHSQQPTSKYLSAKQILAYRQTHLMQSLYDKLHQHQSDFPTVMGFNPEELWRSIYILAVSRYATATQQSVMCGSTAIHVTEETGTIRR